MGATRQTHFITQVAPSTAPVENVGISASNPLKFKANAGLTWRNGNWSAGWTLVRFHSYQVVANPNTNGATTVANQGSLRVPAQTYHDIFGTYRPAAQAQTGLGRILSDAEIRLAARNVFNTEPPFDASNASLYSRFGDPRLAIYEISLRKSF